MSNFIYKILVQYRGNVELLIKSLASLLPLSPCNKSLTSYQLSCQVYRNSYIQSPITGSTKWWDPLLFNTIHTFLNVW